MTLRFDWSQPDSSHLGSRAVSVRWWLRLESSLRLMVVVLYLSWGFCLNASRVQAAVQMAHSRVARLGDRMSQEDQAEALTPCGTQPQKHIVALLPCHRSNWFSEE